MTNEERENAIRCLKLWIEREPQIQTYKTCLEALEQQPCEDIAQERYKDLCEYFGGAKDILKSREDFKAWLERIKWHIRKAEELYEKYEYKKQPCDDAISRDAVCDIVEDIRDCISVEGYWAILERLKKLPPVTQKSETVTEFADRCRECGAKYGKMLKQKSGK